MKILLDIANFPGHIADNHRLVEVDDDLPGRLVERAFWRCRDSLGLVQVLRGIEEPRVSLIRTITTVVSGAAGSGGGGGPRFLLLLVMLVERSLEFLLEKVVVGLGEVVGRRAVALVEPAALFVDARSASRGSGLGPFIVVRATGLLLLLLLAIL